ncbi:hypothetical protein M433DRAFT_9953 [Acidomyces richmondensis BFW]|nr:hypothetical protein M433DRAFT_9953 [Acidomyces richmondensis BFW]
MAAIADCGAREAARFAGFTGFRASDPLDSTELREANALYLTAIESATNLLTLVKRYISRLT